MDSTPDMGYGIKTLLFTALLQKITEHEITVAKIGVGSITPKDSGCQLKMRQHFSINCYSTLAVFH